MSPFVSLRQRLRLRRHGRGYPSGEAGVALVEFALILPFLLLLVFGITDFGRAFFLRNDMTHLANETARYAVVNSDALVGRCQLRWTDWDSGTTYRLGSIVKGSDGTLYSSRVNNNLAHDPATDDGTYWRLATNWTSTTTYTRGAIVGFSDSMYVSLVDNNKDHDPATDDGTHWAPVEKCTIQAAI